MRQLIRRYALCAPILVGLSACSTETIVHGLDEKEANRIIEVLADNNITAAKGMEEDGRDIVYTIIVSGGDRLDAIRTLNRHELPRRRDRGYNEVFEEGGLIPTSVEEKAKHMSSIEGEIERQLKLFDNILDAQVQIVVPAESALRTTQDMRPDTTASVTVRYLPGPNGEKPLSETQIMALVAAGVEGLNEDKVVVVMTPARTGPTPNTKAAEETAQIGGWRGMSAKQLQMIASVGVGVILLLGFAVLYSFARLRSVRGRLERLQGEIAKARRRVGDSSVG